MYSVTLQWSDVSLLKILAKFIIPATDKTEKIIIGKDQTMHLINTFNVTKYFT